MREEQVPWSLMAGLSGAAGTLLVFVVLTRLIPQQPLTAGLVGLLFGLGLTWATNRVFVRARMLHADAAERLLLRTLHRHGGQLSEAALLQALPLPAELAGHTLCRALESGQVRREAGVIRV